jgi:hypothetical protein
LLVFPLARLSGAVLMDLKVSSLSGAYCPGPGVLSLLRYDCPERPEKVHLGGGGVEGGKH